MMRQTPWPVAFSRPCDPPQARLFPVTTARPRVRSTVDTVFTYVSIIQSIVCEFVPTSGAGMSYSGPMFVPSACVKRRVRRISSSLESWFGRTLTPPLAPP